MNYENLIKLNELSAQKAALNSKEELAPLYAKLKDLQYIMMDTKDYLKSFSSSIKKKKDQYEVMLKDKPSIQAAYDDSKSRMNAARYGSIKDQLAITQVKMENERRLCEIERLKEEIEKDEENYKAEKESVVQSLEELKNEYNELANEYNQKKKELDVIASDIEEKIKNLLITLTPEEQAAFKEAVRRNPDSPVAFMDRNSCSECKIGFFKDDIYKINLGDVLMVCNNCHRIILKKKEN